MHFGPPQAENFGVYSPSLQSKMIDFKGFLTTNPSQNPKFSACGGLRIPPPPLKDFGDF